MITELCCPAAPERERRADVTGRCSDPLIKAAGLDEGEGEERVLLDGSGG